MRQGFQPLSDCRTSQQSTVNGQLTIASVELVDFAARVGGRRD